MSNKKFYVLVALQLNSMAISLALAGPRWFSVLVSVLALLAGLCAVLVKS